MSVVSVPRVNAIASASVWSRQTPINDRLCQFLILVLFLAPIPLGSNRPFFWTVNAIVIGLIALFYSLSISRVGEGFRYGTRYLRASIILFVLLCLYLVVQVLPLGSLLAGVLPLIVTTTEGNQLAFPQISLAPGASLLMLLRMVTYGVFFFLILQVATNARRRSFMLHAILVVIVLHAGYGLASLMQFGDTLLGLPKWFYRGNATGTFVNRNSYATFLAFGAVLAVALATSSSPSRAADQPAKRFRFDPIVLFYLLALVVICAALLSSQSRMGTFSGMLGCFAVLLINLFRGGGFWRRLLTIVPLSAAGLGVAFYVYGQGLLERIGSAEDSADVRFDLYKQVLGMIQKRPLLGYGGGAFEEAYPLFHARPVSPDLIWDRAHDTYLTLWSELGVVIGSIPIILIGLALVRVAGGIPAAREDRTARVAAFGVIVVAATHSLLDFSLEIQAVALMFLALVALGIPGVSRASGTGSSMETA